MLLRIYRYLYHWQKIKRDPVGYARMLGVEVGENCKIGGLDRGTFSTEPYLISLGDHVEIAAGVRFITHDGGVWVFRESEPDIDVFAPIRLGNNVFVGMNSLILPGTTVGDNVVIGAGSVVKGDIAADSVVAGVPARLIRTTAEYRKKLQPDVVHIRHMPRDRKRALLQQTFSRADR